MENDPYWNSVVLAMHMDDTGLTDVKGHAVTKVGNVARSATQSKFGGYSAYFDGDGDYLSMADSADWDLGSVFTIEGWVNASAFPSTSGASSRLVSRWDSINTKRCFYVQIYNASGVIQLMAAVSPDGTNTNAAIVSSTLGASIGAWFHFAFVYTGTAVLLFIDGVLVATAPTTASAFNTDTTLFVGSMQGDTRYYFNGYIDDLRITKGVARYTANFTPPTEAFPDTPPQLIGTVKDSSNAFAARTVRAYRRSDGALAGSTTSNGTTGAFSVSALDATAHYAVCLDNDLDENALILDNITPV